LLEDGNTNTAVVPSALHAFVPLPYKWLSLSAVYDIAVTQQRRNTIATVLQQCPGIVQCLAMHPYHPSRSCHIFRALIRLIAPMVSAVLTVLMVPLTTHAAVYFYEAEDGSTHYSDQATNSRFQLLIADNNPLPGPDNAPLKSPRAARGFEREIAAVARTTQVEAALIHAVIAVESNYNPRAISPKGALGLMQLMPSTAREYGVKNPMDALQNIQGGAQHLRKLLDRFANNTSLALAAYNAGTGAVIAHGGQIPPYAETRNYVPEVLRRYASNQLLVPFVSD
jgi:hypothetical protein